jgi:hypothetical protein
MRIGLTIDNHVPIGLIREARVGVQTEFDGERFYEMESVPLYYFQPRYDSERSETVFVMVFDADRVLDIPEDAEGGYESLAQRIYRDCPDTTKLWVAARPGTVGRLEWLSETRSSYSGSVFGNAEIRLHCVVNIKQHRRGVIVFRVQR